MAEKIPTDETKTTPILILKWIIVDIQRPNEKWAHGPHPVGRVINSECKMLLAKPLCFLNDIWTFKSYFYHIKINFRFLVWNTETEGWFIQRYRSLSRMVMRGCIQPLRFCKRGGFLYASYRTIFRCQKNTFILVN